MNNQPNQAPSIDIKTTTSNGVITIVILHNTA